MSNVILARDDYFQDICYGNLQTRRKFVSERDFPIQNSYAGQVQCLSHSRDQKLVKSLVQSAISYHGAFDRSYAGIRISESFVANL